MTRPTGTLPGSGESRQTMESLRAVLHQAGLPEGVRVEIEMIAKVR